jgi:hypothetical protein
MIPLWNLAGVLRALEPVKLIDSTSPADRVPLMAATEHLMALDDRNRRSGQHDKWIIADSLRKVQLGK